MAYSKCPKCESNFFEVVENSPSYCNYKLLFVQCSKCGSVVGVMDYWNIGTVVKSIEEKVTRNSSYNYNSNLDILNQNIARLFNLVKQTNDKLDLIESKLNK